VTALRNLQTRQPGARSTGPLLWLVFVVDAGLLVASGLIHLHLWDIAYRHVKVLDVLFLVQVAAAIIAAVLLLATRNLLIVLGSALLMIGTIVGFILARTVGIFGFRLTFSSGLANAVLVVEAAAILMLGVTAAILMRSRSTPPAAKRAAAGSQRD
jgi:hypothetical protein